MLVESMSPESPSSVSFPPVLVDASTTSLRGAGRNYGWRRWATPSLGRGVPRTVIIRYPAPQGGQFRPVLASLAACSRLSGDGSPAGCPTLAGLALLPRPCLATIAGVRAHRADLPAAPIPKPVAAQPERGFGGPGPCHPARVAAGGGVSPQSRASGDWLGA